VLTICNNCYQRDAIQMSAYAHRDDAPVDVQARRDEETGVVMWGAACSALCVECYGSAATHPRPSPRRAACATCRT
jgi:hypothetical protein